MPDKKVKGVITKLVIADILSNFSAQTPATKPINAKNNDPNNVQWDNIDFDHLLEKEQEYAKWNERNDDWMIRR